MLGFVIGDGDLVSGLRLVGVEGVEAASAEQAEHALEEALKRTDLALIIVSEELSSQPQLRKTIDAVRRNRTQPLIVEVPGSGGKPSQINMSDLVSKSLGVRM